MAKAGNVAKKAAGLKLPDAVPGADWINGVLHSPLVREAIAAALVAGAAAAAQVLARSDSGAGKVMRAGVAAVADEGRKAGNLTKDITEAAVGTVVGLAASAAQNLISGSASEHGGKSERKPKGRSVAAARKPSSAKKRKP